MAMFAWQPLHAACCAGRVGSSNHSLPIMCRGPDNSFSAGGGTAGALSVLPALPLTFDIEVTRANQNQTPIAHKPRIASQGKLHKSQKPAANILQVAVMQSV